MSSKTKTSKLKERTAKIKYQLELDRKAAANMVAAAAVRLTNLSRNLKQQKKTYKLGEQVGGKKKRKTQKRKNAKTQKRRK
jgi:hypothetical protein